MSRFKLTINGSEHMIDADPDMPLLWVLRDLIGLTGTKYSCGVGYCGACMVLVDGVAIRSCITPISQLDNSAVTTIEAIGSGDNLHPVQQAWLDAQVSQCGYCQSGQIIAAIALLNKISHPTDAEIDAAMRGNLCRCGTYSRIRGAIHQAAQKMGETTAIVQAPDTSALPEPAVSADPEKPHA